MGGITFIIYNNININIDFIKSFMGIKYRGINETNHIIESSVDLNTLNTQQLTQVSLRLSKNEIQMYKQYSFVMGFHRMCVNDMSFNGSQPFEDPILHKLLEFPELKQRPLRKLICNGEIYNYKDIITTNEFTDKDLCSESDVETILPLYIKYNLEENSDTALIKTINDLDGDFAFVLTENLKTYITSSINVYVVRDYLGIKPLFYVTNNTLDFYMFVSEIKGLPDFIINNDTYEICQVPPGSFWSFQNRTFTKYYDIDYYKDINNCIIKNTDSENINTIYTNIKNLITDAVISRYGECCEVNENHTQLSFGILLSGGFDSSLITSILIKYLYSINHDFTHCTLDLFTIGDTLGSIELDVNYAKEMVEFLKNKYPNVKINHHIIYINDIEILTSDIETIIYHLETFDPETIRESIPYYYLFKYISEKTNVKVLLSGDGLDELSGGYSNFSTLSDTDFQLKSIELLKNLCNYDILRTDRMSNAFSLELRHPFLQKKFVEYILSIHPKLKRFQVYKNTEEPIEKYIIRKSFDVHVQNDNYLPESILWKRSLCVCESLSNFELRLHNYFNEYIDDQTFNFKLKSYLSKDITLPKTKEELFYRQIFEKIFPNRNYLVSKFWNNIWDSDCV
jgi:asparagine synthase (glutamine-hydrolysing)